MSSWIQGSESVNVVNNTQGLTQGSYSKTIQTTQTYLCIYEAHLHTQIHRNSQECDRVGEVSDSFSVSWRQIKSVCVHSSANRWFLWFSLKCWEVASCILKHGNQQGSAAGEENRQAPESSDAEKALNRTQLGSWCTQKHTKRNHAHMCAHAQEVW